MARALLFSQRQNTRRYLSRFFKIIGYYYDLPESRRELSGYLVAEEYDFILIECLKFSAEEFSIIDEVRALHPDIPLLFLSSGLGPTEGELQKLGVTRVLSDDQPLPLIRAAILNELIERSQLRSA